MGKFYNHRLSGLKGSCNERLIDEKGMFKFGGSTVILVFDNSKLQWDADLLENTRKGYETLIRMGMTLASAKN